MRPRATDALARLPDTQLFVEVARGLELTASWIGDLERWAADIGDREAAGADVLRVVANEEAARFLILIDAIRCPRRNQKLVAQQFKRCNQHLSKGLYVEACDFAPPKYEDLLEYLHFSRLQYYLDGPNEVDWVFRNRIEGQREERLYVDYVEADDGYEWWAPNRFDHLAWHSSATRAVRVVGALVSAGLTTAAGVEIAAKHWRAFDPRGKNWRDLVDEIDAMVELLEDTGHLGASFNANDRQLLHSGWQFPLYGADLSMIPVSIEELRDRQAEWDPYA